MIHARFSPKAERDLDELCGYIAADNPDASERVRQVILNTADFLAQHPEIGRRIRNATPRSRANPLVRGAEVPQLPDLLPAVSRNGRGRQSVARGAGLDAILSRFARYARVGYTRSAIKLPPELLLVSKAAGKGGSQKAEVR